jgi:putative hydrolase of the HAD superfamily
VIFFDAVGTLFQVRGSVGQLYSRVAADCGVQVDAQVLDRAFFCAFKTAPPAAFPHATAEELPQLERAWWQDVVERTFQATGQLDQFPNFARYFDEVFQLFATKAAWELYDETLPVLEQLRSQGIRLATISNFDSRLFAVLEALGLRHFLSSVTVSTAVGAAKPAAGVFAAALRQEGVEPGAALHIGDSASQDYRGAKRAGLQALWLHRLQPMMAPEGDRPPLADTIADLSELLTWLARHMPVGRGGSMSAL